eukprot:6329096-Pyramimonas_sp.AAC.1
MSRDGHGFGQRVKSGATADLAPSLAQEARTQTNINKPCAQGRGCSRRTWKGKLRLVHKASKAV